VPGEEDDQQRFQLIAQWRELAYRNFERLRDADTDAARAQVTAEMKRTLRRLRRLCDRRSVTSPAPAPLGMLIAKNRGL